MPNRTIYVADADLPIFEKAQKLAGDNLSAAIAQALHYFVEKEEAKRSGFEEITVKVGKGRPYLTKQFRGRLLAKRRIRVQNGTRILTLVVYQTAKGRFAIYTKNTAKLVRLVTDRQNGPGNQLVIGIGTGIMTRQIMTGLRILKTMSIVWMCMTH